MVELYACVERNIEVTELTVAPGQILYSTDHKVEKATPYFSDISEVSEAWLGLALEDRALDIC